MYLEIERQFSKARNPALDAGGLLLRAVVGIVIRVLTLDSVIGAACMINFDQPPLCIIGIGDGLRRMRRPGQQANR